MFVEVAREVGIAGILHTSYEAVPIPAISAPLFGRFESRGDADYADRILSVIRKQFGGHEEKEGSYDGE